MTRNITIQLKAVFLLAVFGLNTVTGFACAMGVDMGFNAHHHDEEVSVLDHTDGKKHQHHDEAEEHQNDKKDASKKDDCCSNKVVKLIQTDKAVPQSSSIISPVFLTAFISVYYQVAVLYPSQVTGNTRYFARSYHPPISNIRIAIQSFQI